MRVKLYVCTYVYVKLWKCVKSCKWKCTKECKYVCTCVRTVVCSWPNHGIASHCTSAPGPFNVILRLWNFNNVERWPTLMYVTPSVPSRPYIAASVTSSNALVASSNTITEILLLLYSTRANANLCCSPRDSTCADELSYHVHVHVVMHVRTYISYITNMVCTLKDKDVRIKS